MTARFVVDLASEPTALRHAWEHTVGSCHAPLALRADWQSQLRQAHEELGFRHVRFHGLLSDDVGTLVCQKDELIHSFRNIDVAYDSLLDMGVRPFVELSFMPTALASGDRTVFRYKANVTPPRDLEEWRALIRRLAEHWLDRYGKAEVSRWSFEVWNEPNLKDFWTGTRSDYFDLYRASARALKEAESELRVGGPATARNAWIPEFLKFCATEDVPVDFVTTHHYPTDGFEDPEDDTEERLSKARRGILREQASKARSEAGERELHYTEWNSSSNSRDPLHDQPYAAAFVAKTALEADEIVDGYAFWTFSDVFEETYFPSLPFHGGFGLLTIHGIPKPTYRAFQLLHELGNDRYEVTGNHPTVDAWAVRDGQDLTILLTNHALPRHPIEDERVEIEIRGGRRPSGAELRRIDEDHANAVAAWRAMGAPEYPTRRQVEEIVDASRFQVEPLDVTGTDERTAFTVALPQHAVASVALGGK